VSERGSILPLIAGFAMVCLVLIFGISASTSLLVERARLFSLADSAALHAAESFLPRLVTRPASGVVAPVDSAGVRSAVVDYLARVGPGPLEGVRLERALSPDARTVEVTLSSLWAPPVVSEFLPSSLRIAATARAQVFIR